MDVIYGFRFNIRNMRNGTGIKIGIAEKNSVEGKATDFKLENMITYLNSVYVSEDGSEKVKGVLKNVSSHKNVNPLEEGDLI